MSGSVFGFLRFCDEFGDGYFVGFIDSGFVEDGARVRGFSVSLSDGGAINSQDICLKRHLNKITLYRVCGSNGNADVRFVEAIESK